MSRAPTGERAGRGLPGDAGTHRRVRRGVAAATPWLVVAAGLAGCGGRGGHESRGRSGLRPGPLPGSARRISRAARDKADPPRVWAKLGAAALHAGELRESAEAYLRLAQEDPTRAEEAAEGLDGVARAAERAGNVDVLAGGGDRPAGGRPRPRHGPLRPLPGASARTRTPPTWWRCSRAPSRRRRRRRRWIRCSRSTAARSRPRPAAGRRCSSSGQCSGERQDTAARGPARRASPTAPTCSAPAPIRPGRLEDAALWFAESARMDSTTPTGRRALLRLRRRPARPGRHPGGGAGVPGVVTGGAADSMGEAAAGRLPALGMSTTAGDSARTGPR